MKFSTTAVTLLAGAIASADAYSCEPARGRFGVRRPGCSIRRGQRFLSPFSSFPSDMFDTNPSRRRRRPSILDKTFEELEREMNEKLNTVYPEYQVNSNDELLSVSVDLPGVDASNIDVLVEKDEFLTIKGVRETKNSKYQFKQTFRFDPSIVLVDKLEANLENGVLTVTAPKEMKKEEEKVKKVPINVIKGDKAETVSPTTLQAKTTAEESDENQKEDEASKSSDESAEPKEEAVDLDMDEKDLGDDKTTTI